MVGDRCGLHTHSQSDRVLLWIHGGAFQLCNGNRFLGNFVRELTSIWKLLKQTGEPSTKLHKAFIAILKQVFCQIKCAHRL